MLSRRRTTVTDPVPLWQEPKPDERASSVAMATAIQQEDASREKLAQSADLFPHLLSDQLERAPALAATSVKLDHMTVWRTLSGCRGDGSSLAEAPTITFI